MSAALGWTVLALVFLDELLAVWAGWLWGRHAGGPLLAIVTPIAVVVVWFLFASPKARFGGPVVRPVVKVIVFGLGTVGLWVAGHHALGGRVPGLLGGRQRPRAAAVDPAPGRRGRLSRPGPRLR